MMRMWVAPAVLALAVAIVPLAPVPGAASEGRAEVTVIVAEALRMEQRFVELWNDKNFDELAYYYYTEDAIAVPPNHEPIRGRTAIIEYFKGARDALGELEVDTDAHRATTSGDLVSLVGKYSFYAGKLRLTSHELYQRQADGSLKCLVDMFGFRDPLS
jgi:ketosteroid isomerase-like protein